MITKGLKGKALAEIYKAVKSTVVYNYQQARIPLDHKLKMDVWRRELVDYPDHDLCVWLEFGWPPSFNENSELQFSNKNHSSAEHYPKQIK